MGNLISPYIGIGWGNPLAQTPGWGMTSDFGLLFHGRPSIKLTNQGCTADTSSCALVASQVANEEARLNAGYSSRTIYPAGGELQILSG